jgi:4-hydroxyphenylacetate 3-monooxygenase
MAEKSSGGARRGQQVLQRLREQPPSIWYRGELVKDVTVHPALQGGVHTLARLYDLQWEKPDITLYDSPTTGRKVARSFMMPKTRDELASIMVEIIQQIGASGLVAMPTEQDLKGPLVEDIKRYYQAARAEAFDRIPLFRLAWDASISAFAGRQVLYERFFFGDPVRMAGALVTGHAAQIQQHADMVRAFVKEGKDEAFAQGVPN